MKRLLLNIQMFGVTPTNGTHELPLKYASRIKALFRKQNNLRQFAGRDIEGDITLGAAQIPVRDTEVTVGDYDVLAGGALGNSTTTYLTLPVIKNKFINELVDGYEAASIPDGIKAQRLSSGAYSLQRTEELDFIASIRDSLAANDAGGGTTTAANPTYETSTVALTNTTAFDALNASIGEMLDDGVDPADIHVGISTAMETLLLTDTRYTNTASQVGSERAMNGVVNVVRGVEITRSSNLGVVSATGANLAYNGLTVEYIVFSKLWAQTADAWKVLPEFVDLKGNGTHIGASALQAREMYINALTDSKGARVKARA